MGLLVQAISSIWPDSKISLERLRTDLNGSLDKLMTREKYLNEQFDSLMLQYRGSRGMLSEIQVCVIQRGRKHAAEKFNQGRSTLACFKVFCFGATTQRGNSGE